MNCARVAAAAWYLADRRRLSRAGRGVSREARRQHRRHDCVQLSSGEASDDRRRRHGDDERREAGGDAAALSESWDQQRSAGTAGVGPVVLRDGPARVQLPADGYCLRAGTVPTDEFGGESRAAAGDCCAIRSGIPGFAASDTTECTSRGESCLALVPDSASTSRHSPSTAVRYSVPCARKISVSTYITFPCIFIPTIASFGYRDGEFPVAEAAYERLISLPMFHGMTDADVGDVVRAVNRVISSYAK